MAVYTYSRVSTGNQGMSLKVQKDTLIGYAMTLQMDVDRHFVDENVSGSLTLASRPEGEKMVAALEAGDCVLVAKFDRLFRNSEDALVSINRFGKQGVRLFILDMGGEVTGEGVGKLIYTVLAAVADFERGRIAERIRDVKAIHIQEGRYLGGKIPWGHFLTKSDGTVYVQQEHWLEQALLEIATRHWKEGQSTRLIANYLSATYAPISHKTVAKLSCQLKDSVSD